MSKLSDASWNAIRIRYEAGDSIRGIAKDFGIVDGTIRKRAKDENWVIAMRELNNELVNKVGLLKNLNLITGIGSSIGVDIVKQTLAIQDLEFKTKIIALMKLTPKDILDMLRAPPELNLIGDDNTEDDSLQPLQVTFVKKNN